MANKKCGRSEAVPVWVHPLSFDCFLFYSFEMQSPCKSAGAGLLNDEKTLRKRKKGRGRVKGMRAEELSGSSGQAPD